MLVARHQPLGCKTDIKWPANVPRARVRSDHRIAAVAPNVLDCSFEAAAPHRKCIADFTYVWTAEGWLYVAAVVHLFARSGGRPMSTAMSAHPATDALL